MQNIRLNNISDSVFAVSSNNDARADIIASGRVLAYEYARKGANALASVMGRKDNSAQMVTDLEYKALNEQFQVTHLLYAAKKACEMTGEIAPESFDAFKRDANRFYGNSNFYRVLQGIYQDVLTPILPRVISEAVSVFADVVEVAMGETYALEVESDDIVIFQDSAWGAQRSVPANRFYSKDITLNPSPKTAEVRMKWHQLVANGTDFGRFFANISAGMYAKIMGMWNAAMTAAAADTTKIPSGLIYNFSSLNWVTLANKLAALNGVGINNITAFGNAVALAKVLPTQSTGSTATEMDAALVEMLGADYIRSGYLGQFMSVGLQALTDAVVPNTQHGNVTTILDATKIFMMASNGRKPLTIAMMSGAPLTIEIEALRTASFENIFNMTFALDSAAIFGSKIGLVNIS